MASQVYEFGVEMTCEGCANAVTNVLNKKEGVNDIQIDLEGKKVFVTSRLPSDEILQTIKKTGKACQYLGIKK
ncbi:antioxidant 1 copper chaperone [Osmia lignaria lignaria]|uniref:copper transport protein ATOX1 n=1 Tax=Osmia bicornis bicornis TaxID=1437191 RepID=UPI0010F8D61F|nr:copper transport protein ATOX1 [Osmia bicornis bicornis]XP_034171291.1 copper transport protein ATOX1 [Osmia lignaria]